MKNKKKSKLKSKNDLKSKSKKKELPENLLNKFEESYDAIWGKEFKEMAIPIFKEDKKTGEWKGGFYMPSNGRTVTFWKAVQKNKWRIDIDERVEDVPEMVYDEGATRFGYKVTNKITIKNEHGQVFNLE